MHCPQCQHENAQTAKFCRECGAKLTRVCPRCSHEVNAKAKFCSECGIALSQQPVPLQGSASQPHRPEAAHSQAPTPNRSAGERRHLTVMFCDMVGSTALSEQLDPEELREIVRAYQQTCAEVINHFAGYIAQYLGDGLLVYFGYPTAHEDDAQRAVRVGLRIVAAIHASSLLTTRLARPLQVRIGIHTGQVVIGDIGEGQREPLALGETPTIAARMQEIAEPDTVVVSDVTYRLIEGAFESQDLGPQVLKGLATPLPLYRIVREIPAPSRFEVTVTRGLTPLVGRAQEVGLLVERWERVLEGEGQVVLLCGEPGIGKSRLVQELKERLRRQGVLQREFQCSPYHSNSALYPVIDHVQRLLQFVREEAPADTLKKLERVFAPYRFVRPASVPLLAALLSLPHPEGYPPLNLSPQRQKQNTQDTVVAWLSEEAEHRPVLSVWEDLQWADPSTLELLSLFLDQVPTIRMLVLLTFRPEFIPPWAIRSHVSQMTLSRLPHKQAALLIERVARDKTLPAEVTQQVIKRTDGVPLFVEELTKMVLESGWLREAENHYELTRPLPPLAIPATLHDSLLARLDRLATTKEVVQLGAVLGREFSYDVLQAVSPLDDTALQKELTRLVEAELLYQKGLPPQTRYLFKHALIQDVAYQTLLKSRRQQLHQRVAQVLEKQFPTILESQPELVAYHYTEAGLISQAVPYWHKAGQKAIERSANLEAVAHLSKGLELLSTLPDTPERIQQELLLQIVIGVPLVATKGYGAAEVEKAYARARELCRQVGETPQLFLVLHGLWRFYLVRAELQTAQELATQLLQLAQRLQDPALLLEAHWALGLTLFNLGHFVLAQEHLERSIALYDAHQHHTHVFLYGQDPGVASLAWASWTLWWLGYPDQALKRSQEAVALAREQSYPHSLAGALDVAAQLLQFRREGQAVQETAEAAIALSNEQRFAMWSAVGMILRGWALAEQGRAEEGVAQTRRGLTAWRDTGAKMAEPYFLGMLADAYRREGHSEEALATVAEALNVVDQTGERFYEAELYRLKGELILQQWAGRGEQWAATNPSSPLPGPHREAEACFQRAMEIARSQRAKSLELRSVMSLGRLWRTQGKSDAAQQILADVYGGFTEGFDTVDLKEAQALLRELS